MPSPQYFLVVFFRSGLNHGFPLPSREHGNNLCKELALYLAARDARRWYQPAPTPPVLAGPGWALDGADVLAARVVENGVDPEDELKKAMMQGSLEMLNAQVEALKTEVARRKKPGWAQDLPDPDEDPDRD